MTHSDGLWRRAAEIVDQLSAALDNSRLAQDIDAPIDRAAMAFDCPDGEPLSHRQFIETVAGFLRHLCAQACPRGRQLSSSQARDEAVALLQQGYQGTFSSGYEEALLDAADPCYPGVPSVLLKVAELVKARQREMHIRWVTACHIDPADWRLRCAVATLLLEPCRHHLPAPLCWWPPERLIDDIQVLVTFYLARPDEGPWVSQPG